MSAVMYSVTKHFVLLLHGEEMTSCGTLPKEQKQLFSRKLARNCGVEGGKKKGCLIFKS